MRPSLLAALLAHVGLIACQDAGCSGYKEDSYVAKGDHYIKMFNTHVASYNIPPSRSAWDVKFDHAQQAARTTTFDTSVGDPWVAIAAATGLAWEDFAGERRPRSAPVRAGLSGYMGWTPEFRCTKGTLETCDGKRTEEKESCAPFVLDKIIMGDYGFVQTS
ncbi:hypothetical protein PG984_005582 [Apiospora sp. TS-2023a]